MPSRQIPPQPLAAPTPPPHHRHHPLTSRLIPPLSISAAAAVSILLLFTFCFRKITRKRTVPSDSKPPHRFSYSVLRRATANFSSSLRLGQGGFGSVYRGTLPNNQFIAVKVMDSGSLQGEREFHNELYFASRLESPYVITAIGFSSDRKRKTMLLVYELMLNGNLQDALLKRKCEELMNWKQRFSVAVDIAKGLEYLHCLDPPVIHGDVKPSNVLLDRCFSAKLADFGLAWTKMENLNENQDVANGNMSNLGGSKMGETESVNGGGAGVDENVSVVETESVVTCGFEDFNFVPDQSPESFVRGPSQEIVEPVSASPEVGSNLEGISVKNGKEPGEGGKAAKGVNNGSVKDWWWKQENSNLGENKVVKDYVMEWIGSEIKKERPNSEWMGASSSTRNHVGKKIDKKKKNRKRLDWWLSMDEDKDEKVLKKEKRRLPREWWKEEYCEELEKKKKKKNKKQRETMVMNGDGNGNGVEEWWPRDENLYADKKKRSRSRSSRGSVDWMSGELFRPQQNSTDSYNGDIPKSGGISSTPSMRGTLCYVAPEYGSGGALSEKSDVYSFGVLLLVLISGRRPLQVTSSPMSEFQRANLIHWARNLARASKLLDLVDQSVQSLDRDQALTCITVALLCLQKSPVRRPLMKEVVEMLTGESEAPQLPTEFSPSPPSRFPFKARSRRKAQ